MNDEEVEAVARAFFDASCNEECDWDRAFANTREHFRELARIAISAVDSDLEPFAYRVKILIVEDDILILNMLSSYLQSTGFEVKIASTGEEALKLLSLGINIDVLFTDIRLPGKVDGWEIAQIFCRKIPNLKVIYGTGHTDEAKPVPGSEIILKPYRVAQVVDSIQGSLLHKNI